MANNPRRGLIWRGAWLVAVAALVVLWRACAGGPSTYVQIEFGMDPEYLTGARVVIDGEVVGTLERLRGRTLNGFPVDEGDHTVEVRREGCTSETARVTTGFGGTTVRLMAEPAEAVSPEDGSYGCVVRLQP